MKNAIGRKHFGIWGTIAVACLAAVTLWQGDHAKAQTGGDVNGAIELVDPKVLRVCADPHHLPFSNEAGQGFENKIAELFAKKLGKRLAYTFYPDSTGFIRNTLNALRCDVIMGTAQGNTMVQTTNPYYRASYVLVTKKGSGLDGVTSFADPRLKGKHIGIIARTAPSNYLVLNDLVDNMKAYPLVVDTRFSDPNKDMLGDLEKGVIDAAVMWGPIGGYLTKNASVPMNVVPLVKDANGPQLVYRICMGVRHSDQNWKRTLNRLIASNQSEINAILHDYGVPLLDEKNAPITH